MAGPTVSTPSTQPANQNSAPVAMATAATPPKEVTPPLPEKPKEEKKGN